MKNQNGFSIVELIISIIVGVTFISSMNLVVDNYNNLGKQGRNLVLANSYAEAKMEALRNTGFQAINTGTTDLSSELPAQLPAPRSASMVVSVPQAGLKQIDVTISYNDLGTARNYSYRTYIGELGVGQ